MESTLVPRRRLLLPRSTGHAQQQAKQQQNRSKAEIDVQESMNKQEKGGTQSRGPRIGKLYAVLVTHRGLLARGGCVHGHLARRAPDRMQGATQERQK